MADVMWTSDQKDAINSKDGTVLVSAAAGSGKTAVLVERVISILTNKDDYCGIDEMLIVTFTKAAASQMREKISKRLSKMIQEHPEEIYLRKQKMLIGSAKICTIDSFCNDVIKSNYHKTDIPSTCRFIDDGEKKCIMSDVYEDLIEKYYDKKDENFNSLADEFISSGNDNELKNKIFSLYDYSCAYPFEEEWIAQISDDIGKNSFKWKKCLLESISSMLEYNKNISASLFEKLKEDDIAMGCYGSSIQNDADFFEKAYNMSIKCNLEDDSFDKLSEFVLNHKFPKIGRRPKNYDSHVIETVSSVRKLYSDTKKKERLDSLFCSTSEQDKMDNQKLYPILKMMSKFVLDFAREFKKRKIEKNCMDFSDCLHCAIGLLVDKDENGNRIKTNIAKQYSEKFRYIFVDEYQDTNYAQDMLFEAISRDGNNLFFVGDVKQSIYGFRQAMPQLFIEKRKSFDCGDEYPKNIFLFKNFRSRKGIIDWTNYVFSSIMSNQAGGIDYDEREQLVCGADYPETQENEIEINIVNIPDTTGDDRSENEAELVAMRVEEILKSEMQISDGGETRPVRKGDICILLRSSNVDNNNFAKALLKRNIDCVFDSNEDLFDASEIRIIISFLKVINDPLDDIAMLSVMMSPIFGFNADEIALLRLDGGRNLNIYKCVSIRSENGDRKCKFFLDKLSQYRLQSVCLSVHELIELLISESSYDSMVLSMSDSETRKNNIYLFRDYAKNLSSNGNLSLSSFLRIVEKIRQNKFSSIASPKSLARKDAVSIMSIHKSKGLEFPICILARCSKRMNLTELKDRLLIDPVLGVGLSGRDEQRAIRYETINHLAVKNHKKKLMIEEEIRILYVAMTRAKEKLIMFFSPEKLDKIAVKNYLSLQNDKSSPYEVLNASGFEDWLLVSALRHKDCSVLRNEAGLKDNIIRDSNFSIDLRLIKQMPESEQARENEQEKHPADAGIVDLINKKIDYKYKYSVLKNIPSKRGASDGNEKINLEFFASLRPAFMDKQGLSPAQRGSAMHLFMQHCNYIFAKNDLENEIIRVENKGFLNKQQVSSLDRKKLLRFFSSSLAERIFSSPLLMREKKFIINMTPQDFGYELNGDAENEKIMVQGIIDCAFVEDGRVTVVDYKTDRVSNEQELRDKYSAQLSIYTKAVKECFGMKVGRTVIYSFFLDKEIDVFN